MSRAPRPAALPALLVPLALFALGVAASPAALAAEPAPAARERLPVPPLGTPRDFALPDVARLQLPNGLRATFVPFGAVPKTTIAVVVRTGNVDDPVNGLADVVGELLREGAGERDAAALARRAAEMGGELAISVRADQTTLSLDVLAEHADEAVALLADVLRRPHLPARELPRIQANLQRQVAVARAQPATVAGEAYSRLLWGSHPYGRGLPSDADIAAYTIDAVRLFHEEQFGATRTHVYVAGRFDRPSLEAALVAAFQDWPAGRPPTQNVPQGSYLRVVELIDRPGAAQSTIRLGLPTIDPTHPAYLPLVVANTLLGGSLISRIDQNLREDKGWTYGARSTLGANYRSGSWTLATDVNTPDTAPALREILAELARLQREPPDAEELRRIQNFRAGTFTLSAAGRGGLLGQLSFLDLHGLPQDWLTRYVGNVYAVTPAEVQQATANFLRPGAMTLVVVGDLAQIGAAVRALPELRGAELRAPSALRE